MLSIALTSFAVGSTLAHLVTTGLVLHRLRQCPGPQPDHLPFITLLRPVYQQTPLLVLAYAPLPAVGGWTAG